jgi:hypothetical protein
MNELASIVVEKLHLRDGTGHFALVVCEHDRHLISNAPDGKIPTLVVRPVTRKDGSTVFEVAYFNVTTREHKQTRQSGVRPAWTFVTYQRIDVAADFVYGFVRRHQPQHISHAVHTFEARDVEELFESDDEGRVRAPYNIVNYKHFDKHHKKLATHLLGNRFDMLGAMWTLTPDSVR